VPQPAIRRTAYRCRISSRYQLRNFITLKATSSSTGGVISVMEIQTSGGSAPYAHSREDESFYILEGAIRVLCEDQVFIASARSFVFLPRGRTHEWHVEGRQATVLAIYDAGGS
jgi:mannose-6-phosphate isomerase-like protein (cupin superfamily)